MKLALGTVQFGLSYGISNKHGQTQIQEIKKIFATAKKNNIHVLDTAPLYEQSEETIGKTLSKNHSFKIVTKTPRFLMQEITKNEVSCLINSINDSLKKLNQPTIYGILFHNKDQLIPKNGDLLLKELKKLKEQNIIQKIGFSVYNTKQIDQIINSFEFDMIQLPINVLDQKLLINGYLKKLKKLNIEIHARSIFLQGLLLMPLNEIPLFFKPIFPILKKYHQTLKEKNLTPLEGALYFAKQINELDYILIGVNNNKQLIENINAYNKKIDPLLLHEFTCDDEKFTNPMNWNLK